MAFVYIFNGIMSLKSSHVPKVVVVFLILLFCSTSLVSACKNIFATGDATAGEYNLLLKVRDPSRTGVQVLTLIPQGYEYTYHHPWTGKTMDIVVNRSYIGVTSQQDIPPNIVKSGMVLTDAGLAFGDADSRSRWINPTQYAWDDFDWIRYSCEHAATEEEAVNRLTALAVDELHATRVSENLCVVGPEKGYLIEADAYRYHLNEIVNDVDVISNYPRELWNTQIFRSRLIADAYNATRTNTLKAGESIHLNGISRIQLLQISDNSIKARQIPFFTNIGYHDGKPSFFMPPVSLNVGGQRTIGDFYVSLINVTDDSATIHLTTAVHAWEQELLERILPRKGNITVADMIEWSRFQDKDMNDVRPMCEAIYLHEGVAIYQIPTERYQTLSKGWFSANRAVSSIYVPFHIGNTEIYEAYETGDAAYRSLSLYENHSDAFLPIIRSVEQVFLMENDFFDRWAHQTTIDESVQATVLTIVDTTMQKQAYIMQQLLLDISKKPEKQRHLFMSVTEELWMKNYTASLAQMASTLEMLSFTEHLAFFEKTLITLMQSTSASFINATESIDIAINDLLVMYDAGNQLLDQQKYREASVLFQQIILQCKSYFDSGQV
jgi:hypothetical protein